MIKTALNWTAVQLRALKSKEDGQGMVEYALIIAFIAIVVIVALAFLGPVIREMFFDIGNEFSPEAAARFIIPGRPLSILSVSQPAIAIYLRASEASVALNFVAAPISLAFSVSAARSSPVAPEIAETSDIPASKLDPTLTA